MFAPKGSNAGLFGGGATSTTSIGGLFGSAPTQPAGGLFGLSNQNTNQQQTKNSSQPQIDIDHLRPTTKFDHLTPVLQSEIEKLDQAIVNQINICSEVSTLIPEVKETGSTVPEGVKFVQSKLYELEIALENDAEEIVALRDRIVRRDVAEGRLCLKSVDRLKMPAQYQHHHHHHQGADGQSTTGGFYGGSGLSGWWNNPQMLQRSVRSGAQSGRAGLQLPEDDEVEIAPGTLVDLFSVKADEMKNLLKENRELLGEIESFVGNVEAKIGHKERDVSGEWKGGQAGIEGERERQIKMLRYVFGEVEKSLYEVADKVGECRDGYRDLEDRWTRGTSGR